MLRTLRTLRMRAQTARFSRSTMTARCAAKPATTERPPLAAPQIARVSDDPQRPERGVIVKRREHVDKYDDLRPEAWFAGFARDLHRILGEYVDWLIASTERRRR